MGSWGPRKTPPHPQPSLRRPMVESSLYRQRLEVIAVRRLPEASLSFLSHAQRKSLRERWLMDGSAEGSEPLEDPASKDPQSPEGQAQARMRNLEDSLFTLTLSLLFLQGPRPLSQPALEAGPEGHTDVDKRASMPAGPVGVSPQPPNEFKEEPAGGASSEANGPCPGRSPPTGQALGPGVGATVRTKREDVVEVVWEGLRPTEDCARAPTGPELEARVEQVVLETLGARQRAGSVELPAWVKEGRGVVEVVWEGLGGSDSAEATKTSLQGPPEAEASRKEEGVPGDSLAGDGQGEPEGEEESFIWVERVNIGKDWEELSMEGLEGPVVSGEEEGRAGAELGQRTGGEGSGAGELGGEEGKCEVEVKGDERQLKLEDGERKGGEKLPDGEAEGGEKLLDGERKGGEKIPDGEAEGGEKVTDGETEGGEKVLDGEAEGGEKVPDGEAEGGEKLLDGEAEGGEKLLDGKAEGGEKLLEGEAEGGEKLLDGEAEEGEKLLAGEAEGGEKLLEGEAEGGERPSEVKKIQGAQGELSSEEQRALGEGGEPQAKAVNKTGTPQDVKPEDEGLEGTDKQEGLVEEGEGKPRPLAEGQGLQGDATPLLAEAPAPEQPAENQPLLRREGASANPSAHPAPTYAPARQPEPASRSEGKEASGPKQKTCQCCVVM
uniref:Paralemmin-3 n=1 Tax=Jaculus jaculus TaxID=51337 RepID=A0A8C5L4G9_JACJA